MKNHLRTTMLIFCGAILLMGTVGCGETNQINEDAAIPANAPVEYADVFTDEIGETTGTGEEGLQGETEDTTGGDGNTSIHVVAVGDNLVQQSVYQSAQAHSADGVSYNFDYCYENVKPLIDGDLNIINQETLICGDEFEISGSNFNFNSPTELGDAVIDMGFNVITMCNNHLLDKGESGLNACLNYWDMKMSEHPEVLTCGVYRDYVDMQKIRTKEVCGKNVAFLSYTENTKTFDSLEEMEQELQTGAMYPREEAGTFSVLQIRYIAFPDRELVMVSLDNGCEVNVYLTAPAYLIENLPEENNQNIDGKTYCVLETKNGIQGVMSQDDITYVITAPNLELLKIVALSIR